MITGVTTSSSFLAIGGAPADKSSSLVASKLLSSNALSLKAGKTPAQDVFANVLSFEKQLDSMSNHLDISPKKLFDSIVLKTNQDLNQTHEMALTVFLKKMKSELGVKPKQIVKAFSKLSLHDLSEPPEASAGKFISELKLNHKDEIKARNLYAKLLGILSTIDQMQNRVTSIGRAEGINFQKAVNTKLAPLQVDQDAKIATSAKIAAAVPAKSTPVALTKVAASAAVNESSASSMPQVQTPPATQVKTPTENEALAQKQPQLVAQSLQELKAPKIKVPNIKAKSTAAVTATATADKVSNLTAYNQTNGGASGDRHNQHGSNDAQNSQAVTTVAGVSQTANIQPNSATAVVAAKTAHTPSATKADVSNNVNEIISRAQFLANKGGGEMKVSLKPEGLGELNLRVNMHHGRLSVEMLASNDDAKKVIEKGLGELKASLAAHSIHVDSIRVDSPQDLLNQFLSQRHQQMEQGLQQQFLSNFQNQNNSNREAMFAFGDAAVPSSQIQGRASNSQYTAASVNKKSNRRLDLVA